MACHGRARRWSRAVPGRARRSSACTSSSRACAGGEPGILFTLEETPAQIRAVARSFGWDLAPLEAQGHLLISYTSPVELVTDRFLDEVLRQIAKVGARRAVLDSLTSMSLGVASQRRFRELVYALTKHFQATGVTPLMTVEVAELLGTAQLTGRGVSSIADNLIVLRYVEVEAHLERAVFVLKARGIGPYHGALPLRDRGPRGARR